MKSSLLFFILIFFCVFEREKAGEALEIPIKSLTNSNIIYTNFKEKDLNEFIFNDKLDYNQFYIDLTLLGKEDQILKIWLDTTIDTNIFAKEKCPECFTFYSPLLFNSSYKGKKYAMGQITSDILLNDDDDLVLESYPVNILANDNKIKIPFDGILGLGLDSFSRMPIEENSNETTVNYSSSSVLQPSNILNYLWKNNYIEFRQFSFALYIDTNKTKLILGGYDGSLTRSSFEYYPVVHPKKWAVNLSGLLINREFFQTSADKLVFDSSTSNLIGPKTDVLEIIEKINEEAGGEVCIEESHYYLKCNCLNLPFTEELFFEIALQISGNDYRFCLEDLVISYEEATGECYFALGYYDDSKKKDKVWIAGTKFFERYYVVFNAENKEISIADVNLEVLMGDSGFFTYEEMQALSFIAFVCLVLSLIYFVFCVLKEGKSSKEFTRVSNSENNVSYLDDGDVFVISAQSNHEQENDKKSIEMKEIPKKNNKPADVSEILADKQIKEEKFEQNENIEDSHTV